MHDWQHALRNRLNLVLYATAAAREALVHGQREDVLHGLARIETAIAECGGLLEHLDASAVDADTSAPGQRDADRAG